MPDETMRAAFKAAMVAAGHHEPDLSDFGSSRDSDRFFGWKLAISSGHACQFGLDHGGNIYRRYTDPQCRDSRASAAPGGEPVAWFLNSNRFNGKPPHVAGMWVVYELRKDGQKLPPDKVLCTGKRGLLSYTPANPVVSTKPGLWLYDKSGSPCLNFLSDARLIRMNRQGMLFHGIGLHSRSNFAECRQTWWCMLSGTLDVRDRQGDEAWHTSRT